MLVVVQVRAVEAAFRHVLPKAHPFKVTTANLGALGTRVCPCVSMRAHVCMYLGTCVPFVPDQQWAVVINDPAHRRATLS